MLLDPRKYKGVQDIPETREMMQKVIDFFEAKGKNKLKDDDRNRVWYGDFLDLVKDERMFSQLLTPAKYGGRGCRWDTSRNVDFNEVLGFYGLHYWYTWQVSILGLGPLWMSKNEKIKHETARMLEQGGIFAFGLSEKEHGADLYSTEMKLAAQADGTYLANGKKYYIGNGNKASLVSTFAKMADTDEFVFFAVGTQHDKYSHMRDLVNSQSSVAEYVLDDYPIGEDDILSKGRDAWDSALNTVNVGKFNLGWASIGICTHAFYEAINHASNRNLFGKYVTEFPHIRQLFVDAWSRLMAMKIFALRAKDYMRTASPDDRRYLLYNPMVKMKVTTEGEKVINLLWDVIAAKGFELDTYFEMAARDIRALPKLEGTVHVNMALIMKFMMNYFINPGTFPEIPRFDEPVDDTFLFEQGPTKGLGGIQFHDYNVAYAGIDTPNLAIFREQVETFKRFGFEATPDAAQQRDIDFLLTTGELFTLVAYGQLILENARIYDIDDAIIDQIFDFMVRDFSTYALQLFHKPSSTDKQQSICTEMIKKPVVNTERFQSIWKSQVHALNGAYEMNP